MIETIKCGVVAQHKLLKIDGMITASCIRFDKVTYELTYFKDGECKQIWLHEDEMQFTGETTQVGFKNG